MKCKCANMRIISFNSDHNRLSCNQSNAIQCWRINSLKHNLSSYLSEYSIDICSLYSCYLHLFASHSHVQKKNSTKIVCVYKFSCRGNSIALFCIALPANKHFCNLLEPISGIFHKRKCWNVLGNLSSFGQVFGIPRPSS